MLKSKKFWLVVILIIVTNIGTAVDKLKAMGYTDLHNLGGLKDAQEKLNFPIKK